MRPSSWRNNRARFFLVLMFICLGLIGLSASGALSEVEGIVAAPLNAVTGFINSTLYEVNESLDDFTSSADLRERLARLEEQLALQQAELIQLREIASDYERLADLLDYTSSVQNQAFITADVIGLDTSGALRSITINRGTRDGIAIGMPVVTQLGLVGRIIRVSANASQVQLITDQNSAVSGRLQTSRAEGSVLGLLTGNLRMDFIPLEAEIVEGDLVVTSGLGGNFPPDIVIGQVVSRRSFDFEVDQEAEVRSLIDFNTLEFVLVITSFEPANISVFDEPGT